VGQFCFVFFLTFVAGEWQNCGSLSDPFGLTNGTMKPFPPVRGAKFTITYTGNLRVPTLSSASQTFSVFQYLFEHWVKGSFVDTTNVCLENTCPLVTGSLSLSLTETIPSFVPSGIFKARVQFNTTSGTSLSCLEVFFNLTKT